MFFYAPITIPAAVPACQKPLSLWLIASLILTFLLFLEAFDSLTHPGERPVSFHDLKAPQSLPPCCWPTIMSHYFLRSVHFMNISLLDVPHISRACTCFEAFTLAVLSAQDTRPYLTAHSDPCISSTSLLHGPRERGLSWSSVWISASPITLSLCQFIFIFVSIFILYLYL